MLSEPDVSYIPTNIGCLDEACGRKAADTSHLGSDLQRNV